MTAVTVPARPLLADQIRSEVIKIRSARALWALPLATAVLGPLTALFVGLTASMEAGDTVLGGALTGVTLCLAAIAAWGALVMSSEYTSGTIRPVLATTPRRGLVLAAKAVVITVIATVCGVVAVTAAYLIGSAMIEPAAYDPGEPLPGLFGIYCCFPAVALLGLSLGVLLRSSAAAVALSVLYVVLPQVSSAHIFGELHKWLTVFAPSAVVAKLAQSSDGAAELIGTLGGWPRLVIVVVTTLASVAVAWRRLEREDV